MQESVVELEEGFEEAADREQYLTFALGLETYGINILRVREIISYRDLTPVPMVPEYIRGLINLRGNVVPIVDLASRLSGQFTSIAERTAIIILEVAYENELLSIGIIVDMVEDVFDISPEEIMPTPDFGTIIQTDFIRGLGPRDEGMLMLLDVDRTLAVEELSLYEEVTPAN